MRIEWACIVLLSLGACVDEKPKQPAVCSRYIACVDATMSLARNTTAYDKNGNCWEGSPERALSCTRACEQALKDLTERTGLCQ